MQERFYRLAGLRFRVHCEAFAQEQGILSGFLDVEGPPDVDCTITVVDQLSEPEGELCFQDPANRVFQSSDGVIRYKGAVAQSLDGAYIRILRKGNRTDVQLKRKAIPYGITGKVIVSCLEAIHHLTAAGGFLLHASWIRVGEKAVLFTGPSGVGKSTQAALWEQHRGAELINGDRAAVFPTADGVQVRGIPYCGSSGVMKNAIMPLAAVVCLSQAETTAITPLKGARAFQRLWQECCINIWNGEDIEAATQSVSDVVSRVPIFHLTCTPDLSAVLALEQEGVL